jgi:hypothetical protein
VGDWFREFFATLPEAMRALYQFGDPQGIGRGWVGAVIMLLWFGPLLALPLWVAKRTYGTHEWVSATMGVMAAGSLLWWVHGVFPHAWIQFTESNQNLLAGPIIPASWMITLPNGYELDIASNLFAVVTEGVVGLLMVAGIVITLLLFLRVQKRLPKSLATAETKPESGGYK